MKCWVRLVAVLALTGLSIDVGAVEKPSRGRRKVFGELTKVEATAITMTLDGKDAERTATFTLGAKTHVLIETDEDEVFKVKGPAGETTMRQPKVKPGTLADLKTGQRISVVSPDATVAIDIVVKRAKKKEAEKK